MTERTVAAIQADLTSAYAARLKAMNAQMMSLDTGQSRQTVTRANLKEINQTIKDLEAELAEARKRDRGDSGIFSLTLRRGG